MNESEQRAYIAGMLCDEELHSIIYSKLTGDTQWRASLADEIVRAILRALAASLPQPEPQEPMPDGMVLVPNEPTKEMIVAGQDEHDNCIDSGYSSDADGNRYDYTTISPDAPVRVYRAMLAAAQAKSEDK